jgi:hypothetical protein
MNHRNPRSRQIVLLLLVPLIVLGSGCAANSLQLKSPDSPCQDLVKRLVRGIDKSNVSDVQAQSIKGFPLFRVDRFHASASDQDLVTDFAKHQWLEGLAELGSEGLLLETARLPANKRPAKPEQIKRCVAQRSSQILADSELFAELRASAKVPDNYSRTKQVVGLYALTSWPVKRGVAAWHEESAERYAVDMRRWASEFPVKLYQPDIRDPTTLDATGGDRDMWLAHAPQLLVQQQKQDQVGRFVRVGNEIQFDSSESAAYVMKSKTRFQGEVLEQLNYLFWMEGRAASSATDILAGKLDGLIWRVTLDTDGEPLIYDSIHPCGCYHLFFPTERLGRKIKPPKREPALIPQIFLAPLVNPLIRVSTTSHYIEGVSTTNKRDPSQWKANSQRYKFVPYSQLRAMGKPDQVAVSLFNNKGLVDETQRLERFLLWMSGIKSPGAMRQWGHHATAFFGRRHFDDADLLDSEFCRVGAADCMPMKTTFD